jgi:DNA-binding NarL/FixJ family response regulator
VDRPIRVVIVEDNKVFREALELLLELRPEFEVVGALDSGKNAAAFVAEARPHVVVIDYRLPGLNGIEVTREIVAASPEVRVVCLTASVSEGEITDLRAAGAYACLTKDGDLDLIIATIHEAAAARCN